MLGNPIVSSLPECVLDGDPACVIIVRDGLMSLPSDYAKTESVCDSLQAEFAVERQTAQEVTKHLLRLPKIIEMQGIGLINTELQELYDRVPENPAAQDFLEKWICDNNVLR